MVLDSLLSMLFFLFSFFSFNPDTFSAPHSSPTELNTVWRMDMEVTMVLISTTLACVFTGLQLCHVKRHPKVLPSISLIMMSILTLGHMTPLVLSFEALLTQNPKNKNSVLGNVGWFEVNEISVRLITMVAFLLQFRLLHLTWSSKNTDESVKDLWTAEKKAACVTLPLYAAGLLIVWLLKLMNDGAKDPMFTPLHQHPSSWENFKFYGGLVLDSFLLPQIILNEFSHMTDNVLSFSFYFGTTCVRLMPHAYTDISPDFFWLFCDVIIHVGGILFVIIINIQQCFGDHYILPQGFEGSKVYEKQKQIQPTCNCKVHFSMPKCKWSDHDESKLGNY